MTQRIAFTVYGKAETAGSKRGFYNKKMGRVIITDDNAKSRPWKAMVSDAALQAMCGPDKIHGTEVDSMLPPLEGPLLLDITFWIPRPKSHYGTGKKSDVLKATAPEGPTGRPDLLKLARGVEDALTGIVYGDDSQITLEILKKAYTPGRARTDVLVKPRTASDAAWDAEAA